MKDFQQRVVDEKCDLDEKIERLDEFLYTDIFAKLNDGDRGLLQAQYIIMSNYSGILQSRIEGF